MMLIHNCTVCVKFDTNGAVLCCLRKTVSFLTSFHLYFLRDYEDGIFIPLIIKTSPDFQKETDKTDSHVGLYSGNRYDAGNGSHAGACDR